MGLVLLLNRFHVWVSETVLAASALKWCREGRFWKRLDSEEDMGKEVNDLERGRK